MDEQQTIRQAVPRGDLGRWQGDDERQHPHPSGVPEFQATVRISTPLRLPRPQVPPPTRPRRLANRASQAPSVDYVAYRDEDDRRRIPWGSLFLALSAALVLVAFSALPFAGPHAPSAVGLIARGKALLLLITTFAAAAVLVVALFSLLVSSKDGSASGSSGFACFLVAIAAFYPLYDAYSAAASQAQTLGGGFWLCAAGVAGMLLGGLATAINT